MAHDAIEPMVATLALEHGSSVVEAEIAAVIQLGRTPVAMPSAMKPVQWPALMR